MAIELTEDQRKEVLSGQPVRVAIPELGTDAVLLRAELYSQIRDLLEDEREQAAFRAFARKQAERLAHENPY